MLRRQNKQKLISAKKTVPLGKLSTVKRKYEEIKWKNKVRRVSNALGRPSFRIEGKGIYSIRYEGKKVPIETRVEHNPRGDFKIELVAKELGTIGVVELDTHDGKTFTNTHREISDEAKGHNLGKLLFRLSEQEAARKGGKYMQLHTQQQDTIVTALSIGYDVAKTSVEELKQRLRLPSNAPLPKKVVLIKLLKEYPYTVFPELVLIRKLSQASE